MRNRWSEFLKDDAGSTTADWIVLTAGVVGLSLASVFAVRVGTGDLAFDIRGSLSRASVARESATAVGIVSDRVAMTSMGCDAAGNCQDPVEYRYVTFSMSDGTEWRLHRTSVWRQPHADVWRDSNGDVVEAPAGANELL